MRNSPVVVCFKAESAPHATHPDFIDSGNGALSVQEDDGPMVTGREIADVEPDLSEYPKPVLVRETNRPAGI